MDGMAEDAFAVAIKRDKRGLEPSDWIERVRRTDGVTIVGESSPRRLQITATSAGLEALSRDLGDYAHIEPIIVHHRS
jgi:hypothetical protein